MLLPKEESKYQFTYKPFDLKRCPVCKLCLYKSSTKLVGVTNQDLIGFQTQFTRWNHTQHCLSDQEPETR